MREKEYKVFVDNQKVLLQRQHDENILFVASSKRLKAISKEINKNNEWLRQQRKKI